MTTRKNFFTALSLFTVLFVTLATGCKKDDEEPLPPAQTSYDLKVKDVLGVTGTITFTETSASETSVKIVLNGADADTHPAHIHLNSAVETGAISITLNPVNASGISITSVTMTDNNTPVNYEQFLEFDGYVNVHESETNLSVIIAQGDIGGNVLTGTSVNYDLAGLDSLGVSGTALFEKRKNENTLITISLTGTITGGEHPAHIHLGSVTTVGGGPIVVSLNDVSGATGKSYTNVRKLDSDTLITYDGLLAYDGYLNVHESASNLTSILCQGNIGAH